MVNHREECNKLAGNLVALGYDMITFEYPQAHDKHNLLSFALYEPVAMVKGRVQSAYIFEYPKDPIDDNMKLKLCMGSIEYRDNMYYPKPQLLVKESDTVDLLRLSYDLIIMKGKKKKEEENGKTA